MRVGVFIAALALTPSVAAAETLRAETCSRSGDARFIEVVAPGEVGAACDVVYRRAADTSVPYHANVDVNFCRARAAELAASLIAEGFSCAPSAAADLEAALAGGPREGAPAAFELMPEGDPLNVQLAKLGQPQTVVAEVAPADPVVNEPVQLAADARPIEFEAPRPPKTTGPGRLVGPAPAIDDIIDIAGATATAPAEALPPRPPAEIIRSLIAADVAAWNEGSLDAFMSGYAQAPDLMIVRDGAVVTGWEAVRDFFAQEIAAHGEMGRLSLGALDVRMTSDDVATVAGRYALARSASASSGVVTLVMKRSDGKWRIVQETRVADAEP